MSLIMDTFPFGNDPEKIGRYKAFWNRSLTGRPLVGFSIKSWFPKEEFAASRIWQAGTELTPDMIVPFEFIDDQERLLREGESMNDDIIRGACPSQAVPWLCGMLGSTLKILPGSALAEEEHRTWEEIENIVIGQENPWHEKYMEFAEILSRRADGRYPISHGTLIGPSDILAALRGHTQSLLDLLEEPERVQHVIMQFARIFESITKDVWEQIPMYHGGYFDAQYQLWVPGPIIRMQEDAAAVYSPDLYRRIVKPADIFLASRFECSFFHLHSTSLHVLPDILDIEDIRCFQINYEKNSSGPDMEGMLPHLKSIQTSGRPLIIRGSFTPGEADRLIEELDISGLYVYIMVEDLEEADSLRGAFGL